MASVSKTSTYDTAPPVNGGQPPPFADAQQSPTSGYAQALPMSVAQPQGPYAIPPGYYAQPVHIALSIDPVTGVASPYVHGAAAVYQQPYVTADGVVVTVVQPVYAAPSLTQEQDPASGITMGRWSVGLCDCCNNCVPNLLMSWCCPCVALAQVYARLGMSSYQAALARFVVFVVGAIIVWYFLPVNRGDDQVRWDPNTGNYMYERAPLSVGDVIVNLVYVALQLGFAIYVFNARMRVRQRFQIPGDACGDCLVSCCCSCCAIAQMATHVKSYRPGDCSFSGPDVLPAFNQ